jgi:hypothetical protein
MTSSGSSEEGSGDSGGTTTTGTSSGTAGSADCGDLEMEACDEMRGCSWVGNDQNGECLSDDPSQCEDLERMACMQNPLCAWNNAKRVCTAA